MKDGVWMLGFCGGWKVREIIRWMMELWLSSLSVALVANL